MMAQGLMGAANMPCGHAVTYGATEPPAVGEVRHALQEAMNEVLTSFVNQSIRATAQGFRELDSGKFVTLDVLESEINAG